MKAYKAVVCFEYDTQAHRAYRGEIVAGKASTAASRAVREARKAMPGSRPASILVLLEPTLTDPQPSRRYLLRLLPGSITGPGASRPLCVLPRDARKRSLARFGRVAAILWKGD